MHSTSITHVYFYRINRPLYIQKQEVMATNTELKRIAVVDAASQLGASIMEALLEYPDRWIIRGIVRDRSLPFSQVG